jgi:hypothetical protein
MTIDPLTALSRSQQVRDFAIWIQDRLLTSRGLFPCQFVRDLAIWIQD